MFFQPICMCIYVYILVMHIPHAHYLYTVLYALFIELHKLSKQTEKKLSRGKLEYWTWAFWATPKYWSTGHSPERSWTCFVFSCKYSHLTELLACGRVEGFRPCSWQGLWCHCTVLGADPVRCCVAWGDTRGPSSFPAAASKFSGLWCGASAGSGSKAKGRQSTGACSGLIGTIHYNLATSRAHIYLWAAQGCFLFIKSLLIGSRLPLTNFADK